MRVRKRGSGNHASSDLEANVIAASFLSDECNRLGAWDRFCARCGSVAIFPVRFLALWTRSCCCIGLHHMNLVGAVLSDPAWWDGWWMGAIVND